MKLGRGKDGRSEILGCLLPLPGLSARSRNSCSVATEGLQREWSGHRRRVEMPIVDSHRPLPVAERQPETDCQDVAYLALPMRPFRPCEGEDCPIAAAGEVFAEHLYHVKREATFGDWAEWLPPLPTLGPGLLAVNGYSHARDALSHTEQRGRLLSLLEVRVFFGNRLNVAASSTNVGRSYHLIFRL